VVKGRNSDSTTRIRPPARAAAERIAGDPCRVRPYDYSDRGMGFIRTEALQIIYPEGQIGQCEGRIILGQ